MTTTAAQATVVVEEWMRLLADPKNEKLLAEADAKWRDQQATLLLELGQAHLQQVEQKNPQLHAERVKDLNVMLMTLELYALIVDCFRKKMQFFRDLLDPATSDELVKAQLPYQQMLEKIVVVERQRLDLVPKFPELSFPWHRYPFHALSMTCLQPEQ